MVNGTEETFAQRKNLTRAVINVNVIIKDSIFSNFGAIYKSKLT